MPAGPEPRSVAELTRASDLVFRGRVLELGNSAVQAVPAGSDIAIVELLEALRVDSVLGDLTGKQITVQLTDPDALDTGEQAIFFTRNWLHGENVAVREIAHVAVAGHSAEAGSAGAEVLAAVAELPDLHLQSRLDSAELVVLARVASVVAVEGQSGRRQSPRWARAHLALDSVIKGAAESEADGAVEVYFPTGDDKQWRDCPRLSQGQRAVFLLRSKDPLAGEWLSSADLPEDALTALDPADVLPAPSLDRVAAMLS